MSKHERALEAIIAEARRIEALPDCRTAGSNQYRNGFKAGARQMRLIAQQALLTTRDQTK